MAEITVKLRFKRRWFFWPAFCFMYTLVGLGMDYRIAAKFMIDRCSVLDIR